MLKQRLHNEQYLDLVGEASRRQTLSNFGTLVTKSAFLQNPVEQKVTLVCGNEIKCATNFCFKNSDNCARLCKTKLNYFFIHPDNKPVADYAQNGEENKGNALAEPLKVACEGFLGIRVEYCQQTKK